MSLQDIMPNKDRRSTYFWIGPMKISVGLHLNQRTVEGVEIETYSVSIDGHHRHIVNDAEHLAHYLRQNVLRYLPAMIKTTEKWIEIEKKRLADLEAMVEDSKNDDWLGKWFDDRKKSKA